MSDSSGDPYGGGNDTYGGGHDTPVPPVPYQYTDEAFGGTPPTSPPPGDTSQDGSDCNALLDLGGLGSLISGLIDVDVGAGTGGNSTHAAALIDVDLGGEDLASVSILGGADLIGGSGILGSLGGLDASCLLDGLLCDGILS